jgi:hypothetical protein
LFVGESRDDEGLEAGRAAVEQVAQLGLLQHQLNTHSQNTKHLNHHQVRRIESNTPVSCLSSSYIIQLESTNGDGPPRPSLTSPSAPALRST